MLLEDVCLEGLTLLNVGRSWIPSGKIVLYDYLFVLWEKSVSRKEQKTVPFLFFSFFFFLVLFCVGVVSGEELFLFKFSPLIGHIKQMITSTSHSETESRSVLLDSFRPHGLYHGILQARILEQVAIPFSRPSSQPRDGTQVSHIAGRFFIN